jgi:ABC-type transport system substrate-binding protein
MKSWPQRRRGFGSRRRGVLLAAGTAALGLVAGACSSTPVTAQDVKFWLNMLLAVPQDWGLGNGFPQKVKDITVVSPTELTW